MKCPCENKDVDIQEDGPCPSCRLELKVVKIRGRERLVFADPEIIADKNQPVKSENTWIVVQNGPIKIEWWSKQGNWAGWSNTAFGTNQVWRVTFVNQIVPVCYCPQCDKVMFMNSTIKSATMQQSHKCRNSKCKASVEFIFDIR